MAQRPCEHARRSRRMALAVSLCAAIAGCGDHAGIAQGVPVNAAGAPPSEAGQFDDSIYLELVRKYSNGDSVDYAAWQATEADMRRLDEHIAAIGNTSPNNRPAWFRSADARRRYWINSYNALVIDAVLDLWPLESVRDVRVSLTSRLMPGKGFFYDRAVIVGGESTNLRDLEQQVLALQNDPRLHFALNCASDSCPLLRASDWSDAELDLAAREFINDPANAYVGPDAVHLSSIFKWYRDDFPEDLYAYLGNFAEPELRAELTAAIENELPRRYIDYDWSLNASE